MHLTFGAMLLALLIMSMVTGLTSSLVIKKCAWDERCMCQQVGEDLKVTCTGSDVKEIPTTIPATTTKLYLSGTAIRHIQSGAFSFLPSLNELFLRDSSVGRPCELETIEPGAFDNLTSLKTLGLIGCTKLTNMSAGVMGTFNKLDNLQIYRSGLTSLPDLSQFHTINKDFNGSMAEIDLHSNKIRRIPSYAFHGLSITALILDDNLLAQIDRQAFKNATIVTLSLSNNPDLTAIHEDAFDGIKRLENLDLSNTKVSRLPTNGLSEIRQLFLKKTPYLLQFPSVLEFNKIETAELYYPHHCCAFETPEKQNPAAWKEKIRREQEKLDQKCQSTSSVRPPTTFRTMSNLPGTAHEIITIHPPPPPDLTIQDHPGEALGFHSEHGQFFGPFPNVTDDSFGPPPVLDGPIFLPDSSNTEDKSTNVGWGPTVPVENLTIAISCGKIHISTRVVKCSPKPDSFNPCEDVMGYMWLRVTVWFVLLAALLGNSVVLLVLITSRGKFTVPKFLMCNLSFADFFMGVYLMLLASIDAHTLGEYFNYAIQWQNEGGCQAAGFLSVFSSELSVFTLTILTLERWYAISHAIHLNKRLKLRHAICLMVAGFVFATILAMLPLVGISGYGNVSICLPMKVEDNLDIGYVVSLLLMNGFMFLVICSCYINMYIKVKGSVATARSNDATIAKRMALLVFTNFACWAPIAFFGLTASAGLPLIDITHSKILLVFFYPLNSCANPFLYAILTKQFRKDVFLLLGKYGICVEKANKYRATYTSRSISQSRGNREMTLHGIHRHSESVLTNFTESNMGPRHSLNGTPKIHPRHHIPECHPFLERSHVDRAAEFANRDLQIKESSLTGEDPTTVTWSTTNKDVIMSYVGKETRERPPYVRSVSGYINPARKPSTCTKYSRFQKSIDTSVSTSTDTTCVSDLSHNNDDIWQILEIDDDCASRITGGDVNRVRFKSNDAVACVLDNDFKDASVKICSEAQIEDDETVNKLVTVHDTGNCMNKDVDGDELDTSDSHEQSELLSSNAIRNNDIYETVAV